MSSTYSHEDFLIAFDELDDPYARLMEEEEEEEAPPLVKMQGIGHEPGELDLARDALERHARIALSNPYERFFAALEQADAVMSAMLPSRIGAKITKPLAKQATAIRGAVRTADDKAKALDALVRPHEGEDSDEVDLSKSQAKAMRKKTKGLVGALDGLDQAAKGVAPAILKAQETITGHIRGEMKTMLKRHHGNLHPKTVGVFDALEKANTYLSIAVGVVASAVGHPEVGAVVKGAIGGLLGAVRAGTTEVQNMLDLRDDELAQMAQPLLSKDEEDVITVENLRTFSKFAGKAVDKALGALGIDTGLLGELRDMVPGFDDVLTPAFDAIKDAVNTGEVSLDGGMDGAVDEAKGALETELGEVRDKIAERLKKKPTDKLRRLLQKLEAGLRGERATEPLDLDGQLESLEWVLDDLLDPSPVSLAIDRMLRQVRKPEALQAIDIPKIRKAALAKAESDSDTAGIELAVELINEATDLHLDASYYT